MRVVLANQHDFVRRQLKHLLSREPNIQVIGEASHALRFQRLILAYSPDVGIIDLNLLPELDAGLNSFSTPIVVLADENQHGVDFELIKAVRSGVLGAFYLSTPPDEIAAIVRATARGASAFDRRFAARLAGLCAQVADSAASGGADGAVFLTERERLYLRLIASGLSNKEIARRLGLAESTVKNSLSALFSKLMVSDRTQAAIYALRHGIVPGLPNSRTG